MKKENEKLQKINADETKSVSGGYILYSSRHNKDRFNVFDNKTGECLMKGVDLETAMKLDRQYNARDLIEQKASTIDEPGEYYTNPNSKGLRKKNK